MENRRTVLGHRQILQQLLGQSEVPINKRPTIKTKTTRKFISVKSPKKRMDEFKSRSFTSLQKQEKILSWAEIKMDEELIHSCYPFSFKSFTNKHFYNMNKKLLNLNEVCEVFREVYDNERSQMKEELKQLLYFQEQLIKKYDDYQVKLEKLFELQQKQKQMNIAKMNKRIEDQLNNRTEKQSKKQIPILQDQVIFSQEHSKIINNSMESKDKISQLDIIKKNQQNAEKQQQQESFRNKQIQVQKKKAQTQAMKQKIKHLKQVSQNMKQKINNTKQQKQSIQNKIKSNNQQQLQIQDQNQKLILEIENKKESYAKVKVKLAQKIFISFLINFPLEFYRNEKIKLSNKLQQLRGNIRVYCRIRPMSKNQSPMNYQLNSHDLLKIKKKVENQKSQNMKTDFDFVFDQIFDQSTTQEAVFGEISQLIQTAINGSNVCIFAYGQTGSGKTFTMQGRKQSKELAGVIPRSTALIFQQLQKGKGNKMEFDISVAVNQIYNDAVVNLLAKSNMKLTKPIFTNVSSLKQVEDLLNKAVANRSTAFTLSNADSSRSHLIFVIRIKFKQQEVGKERESHLVLVDLAGSERVKESGVSKQRLKQAQHINSSLSQLGQVIRSLKSNKGKTNFRNSKLTYFLEPYLQKGSKAVMFVNISPAASDESQTINSLKFASIARECKLQETL